MSSNLQLRVSLNLNYLLGTTVYFQNIRTIKTWHLLGLILVGVGLIILEATTIVNILKPIRRES